MNYLIRVALCFLAAVFSIHSQEMPEPEFIMSSEEIMVPFELAGSKIVFNATIGGETKNIILDTGAGVPVILLDNPLAKSFGLEFDPPLPNGLGLGESPKEAAFAKGVVDFKIDGMEIRNVPVLRTDLASLNAFYGMEIHGVFGGPIFKKFIVGVDYDNKTFTIRKKIADKTNLGKEVLIELHQGRPVIQSKIVLSNGKMVNGRFTLDTGARSTIFHRTFLERNDITALTDTVKVLGGVGFAGKVYGYLSLSKKLTVDEFEMTNTPILLSYNQKPENIGEVLGDDGLIGYDFLRNFNVTFDYRNKRVFLKKNVEELSSTYDRSGMFLSIDKDKNFKVEYVVRNSSAHKAGIKKGDLIVEINKVPARSLKLYHVNQRFKSDDNIIFEIGYIRGSALHHTKFELADLIPSQ